MKKKILLMMVLALASISVLAGCGKKEEPKKEEVKKEEPKAEEKKEEPKAEEKKEEAPAVEEITLKIAYMPNYGSLWSIMNAIDQGFMKEQGINVELVEFQDGPTIIAAMESGSIDMGYIGQGAHKLCINGKAKIFALSHISNGDMLIGSPTVSKLEDLKGKKVAYSSGTSSEDILVKSLEKAGLKMEDIEAIDMDASAIVTAMLSNSVDACATWSPNTLKILDEMKDAVKLTDNMTFSDTTVSLASWIVTAPYAEANRDKVLRFTKALFKAMDYAADDNFEHTAEIIAKQTAGDKNVVYEERGVAEWLTGKEVAAGAANGTVKGYYELQKKNFIAAGAVEVDPPVEDYVMLDLMVEAGK